MKTIFFVVVIFLFSGGDLSVSLEKKANKALKKSFGSENIIWEEIAVDGYFEERPEPGFSLFSLTEGSISIGYLVVTTARGRYEYFDYCVIYNNDLTIRNIEILVYRSDHGHEIANKSWLNQFSGEKGCSLLYGDQIDAISGATFSASSITADINKHCSLLQSLQDKNIIP
mgnify:CR=1 FL=1